jgi:hypothetical protein
MAAQNKSFIFACEYISAHPSSTFHEFFTMYKLEGIRPRASKLTMEQYYKELSPNINPSRNTAIPSIPSNYCKHCQAFSIVEDDMTQQVCSQCGLIYGYKMMNVFVPNGGFTRVTNAKYNANKYFLQKFAPLLDHIYDLKPEFDDLLWTWLDSKQCKVTWRDIKEWCNANDIMDSFYIIPHSLYPNFDLEVDIPFIKNNIATCQHLLKKHKISKLNHNFMLYQVVRMSGYDPYWVPLTIAENTRKRCDLLWDELVRKEGWSKQFAVEYDKPIKKPIRKKISINPERIIEDKDVVMWIKPGCNERYKDHHFPHNNTT